MQSNQETDNTIHDTEEESFTFRSLLLNWQESVFSALRFRKILALAAIAGGLLGVGYAWIRHNTYTAKLTFVVEESKGSGGSIASALAGQFGFDVGSLSGTSGVLAGDNVLELLKSHSLIKKTLLTPYADSSTVSIADRYAEIYNWKEKWKKSSEVGKQVDFPVNQKQFSRLEDSLLQKIITRIEESELSISKPDKKLGFFTLQVTTRDERISQLLCERLLKITTDFYVDTKTKRLSNNVARLQRRADSLGTLLDKRTFSAAEANQFLLDGNPAYSAPTVDAEISTRNKYIQGTVYAEIVKNLEVSKTSLIQETPTVQIVDQPELPLKENKTGFLYGGMVGVLAGFFSVLFLLTLRRIK